MLRRIFALASIAFAVSLLSSTGAMATAQRTFVSGTGDDLNVCTLVAPCRSFSRALTQTNDSGEIIVIDSAGYGVVTIDKSVSIVAPAGVYAGISVFPGADGVVIAGAGIEVALRGLTINGQGGNRGIFYTFGARLRVSHCEISKMSGAGIALNFGGEVLIEDSLIRENGSHGIHIALNPNVIVMRTTIDASGGDGIYFHPSAGDARLDVTASTLARNTASGIHVFPNNVMATLSLAHSTIGQNLTGVLLASSDTAAPVVAFLNGNTIVHSLNGINVVSNGNLGDLSVAAVDNLVSDHSSAGIQVAGTGARAVLDRNTITHNFRGVSRLVNAVIETRSNNTVRENGTDTTGTPYTPVGGV